jgi:hypothetical protein
MLKRLCKGRLLHIDETSISTDSAGDGDQRQYKDNGQGSHGRVVAHD